MQGLESLPSVFSLCQMIGHVQVTTGSHFFVLSKGRNGSKSCATVSILEDNWLTKPKKDRRSLRLAGVGNWMNARR